MATRPTWADVSLTALRQNFRTVQKHVGANVTVCAVVKADAYGHGAVECSRALEAEGARWLGVTSLDEAIPLREAGIRSRILLMTGFWRGEESEIVRLSLTPTVWEPWHIDSLEAAAAALGVARHPVHLKVDTGTGRLGVSVEELPALLAAFKAAQHLGLEGVSTHLASSEIMDAPSVGEQERSFDLARSMVREAGLEPALVHLANTNAVIARRETWANVNWANVNKSNVKGSAPVSAVVTAMVRPGVALYGYYLPFQRAGREVSGGTLRLPVKPILTWKTRILSLRDFGANQALGYGGTYVTRAPAHVAVLPVGYADGYNRQLSNRGRVIVREHYAPILGSISMDLTLVDVTGIPGISVGDEVILLGASEGLSVDALDHARLANSSPYEILCNISKRVPRRYSS